MLGPIVDLKGVEPFTPGAAEFSSVSKRPARTRLKPIRAYLGSLRVPGMKKKNQGLAKNFFQL